MSGKSVCRKLLVEECARICAAKGMQTRVEYPCTDQLPALVTCCDGMVMLNRIGNVMSQPSKLGAYTDAGFPVFPDVAPPSSEPEEGAEPEDFGSIYDEDGPPSTTPKQYGTWGQMYFAIKRELDKMFARPGVRVVVLGFDKKQFVDGVKRITHHKRSGQRVKDRAKQIEKDEAAGVTPTRGIPFAFEDICKQALVPYPWNMTLHGKGQCAALVRFFSLELVKHYKPAGENQHLLIDGHCLTPEDVLPCPMQTWMLDRHPVRVCFNGWAVEHALNNNIGEFDHTAFFYVREIATNPKIQAMLDIDPEHARAANMHIRTNDTDTLMMGLIFLERLSHLHPDLGDLAVIMEIPKKYPVKTDTAVNVRRVLSLLAAEHGAVLQFPGAYFAYGLYLKENDYDMPFMSGIGHATFMSALVNYPDAIGDLVHPTAIPRAMEPRPVPDAGADIDLTNSSDDEAEPDSQSLKRKRSEDDDWTSTKRTRVEDDWDQHPKSSTSAAAESEVEDEALLPVYGPPRPKFDLAFHVGEDAATRFVAACYYDALNYRTKAQKELRESRRREGKLDKLDPATLGHELIEGARKRRKMSGITVQDLKEKVKRHNYYAAITEDLVLGFERSIPFERAVEFGYEREAYRAKLD